MNSNQMRSYYNFTVGSVSDSDRARYRIPRPGHLNFKNQYRIEHEKLKIIRHFNFDFFKVKVPHLKLTEYVEILFVEVENLVQ